MKSSTFARWPSRRGQLRQLGCAALEREQHGDGVERQLAHAPELAGHPLRIAGEHRVDQRHEAFFFGRRADGVEVFRRARCGAFAATASQ